MLWEFFLCVRVCLYKKDNTKTNKKLNFDKKTKILTTSQKGQKESLIL